MISLGSCIAGFLAGTLAAMGMGGGGLLIICLTLFFHLSQRLAQGINLIFFIPVAVVAVIFYMFKNLISWKYAIVFSVLGLFGAFIGSFLSGFFDQFVLRKIFGFFLLSIGIIQFLKKDKKI